MMSMRRRRSEQNDAQERGGQAKVPWNDIRRVAPVLLGMLAAIVMISPNFASASNSVGDVSIGDPCGKTFAVSLADECCATLLEAASTGCDDEAARTVITADPCAVDSPSVLGAIMAPDCEDDSTSAPTTPVPTTTVEPEEAVVAAAPIVIPDPPQVIHGPIWLGAIQNHHIGPGLSVLQFPALLDIFIADHTVIVKNSAGVAIYEGPLPEGGAITVFGDAPFDVVTTLTNRARYYETIPG